MIYLKHIADALRPPHTWDFPPELKSLWFDYLNIEIADIAYEDLRSKVLPGTSPLLLLSKGGARRETLEQIIQQFETMHKAGSLNITRLLAGLIFKDQSDQNWIERRFATMHDFLWENSWTYRQSVEQGIEKGIEKGIEQGVRKDIETFVQLRFPALLESTKERIEDIHGEEALRAVLIALYSASTEQHAQEYLLSLKGKKCSATVMCSVTRDAAHHSCGFCFSSEQRSANPGCWPPMRWRRRARRHAAYRSIRPANELPASYWSSCDAIR